MSISNSELDFAVSKIIKTYNQVFIVGIFITCFILIYAGLAWSLPIVGPAFVIFYFVGLFFIGMFLEHTYSLSKYQDLEQQKIDNEKIRYLNKRLDEGLGISEELEELMIDAGLGVPTVIDEIGPVFGKFADKEMYEWVIVKEGFKGPPMKFKYFAPEKEGDELDPEDNQIFITFKGVVYEHAVA